MGQPKFRLGDRVQVTTDFSRADLRHRVGVVADPGDHLRRARPRWPSTFWKLDPPGSLRIVYWVDFGGPATSPGDICGAEIDEAHLSPA